MSRASHSAVCLPRTLFQNAKKSGREWSNCLDHPARGGNQRPILVATAQEMVEILCALPGNIEFRKNCAQLVVRYLGGDLSLVQKIFQNRAAQHELAVNAPQHPARIFGEAVEARACGATMEERLSEFLNAAESRFKEFVRQEIRRTHPLYRCR